MRGMLRHKHDCNVNQVGSLAGVRVGPAVTLERSNQMLTNDNDRHRDNK